MKSAAKQTQAPPPLVVPNKPKPPLKEVKNKNDDVIDAYIEGILKTGGYVNPNLLYAELLPRIPHIKHTPRFQQLQYVHLHVTAAIDVYCYGTLIRTYTSLEEYIVTVSSKMRRLGDVKCFVDLGVGFLYKHPKVVELFGFIEDPTQLSVVSTQDLIQHAVTFHARQRGSRHFEKAAINYAFQQYLSRELQRVGKGRCCYAINVDFHALLYKLTSRHLCFNESDSIETIMRAQTRNSEEKLKQRVANELSQWAVKGSTFFVRLLLKRAGVSVREVYESLQDKLVTAMPAITATTIAIGGSTTETMFDKNNRCDDAFSTSSTCSPVSLYRQYMQHFFSTVLPIAAIYDEKTKKITHNVESAEFLNLLDSEGTGTTHLKDLFFVCRQDVKSIDRRLFAVTLVSLLLYWSSPDGPSAAAAPAPPASASSRCSASSSEAVSEANIRETIRCAIQRRLGSDIPPELVHSLSVYLLEVCTLDGVITSIIDPLSRERRFISGIGMKLKGVAEKLGKTRDLTLKSDYTPETMMKNMRGAGNAEERAENNGFQCPFCFALFTKWHSCSKHLIHNCKIKSFPAEGIEKMKPCCVIQRAVSQPIENIFGNSNSNRGIAADDTAIAGTDDGSARDCNGCENSNGDSIKLGDTGRCALHEQPNLSREEEEEERGGKGGGGRGTGTEATPIACYRCPACTAEFLDSKQCWTHSIVVCRQTFTLEEFNRQFVVELAPAQQSPGRQSPPQQQQRAAEVASAVSAPAVVSVGTTQQETPSRATCSATHETTTYKKCFGFPAREYVFLACSCLLFSRIFSPKADTRNATILSSDDKEAEVVIVECMNETALKEGSSVAAAAAAAATTATASVSHSLNELSDKLSKGTLAMLSALGERVKDKLSVPAFECAAAGNMSFVQFLYSFRNGSLLQEYYCNFFEANMDLLPSSSASHNDDREQIALCYSGESASLDIPSELLWCIHAELVHLLQEHQDSECVHTFENQLEYSSSIRSSSSSSSFVVRILTDLERAVSDRIDSSFQAKYGVSFNTVLWEGAYGTAFNTSNNTTTVGSSSNNNSSSNIITSDHGNDDSDDASEQLRVLLDKLFKSGHGLEQSSYNSDSTAAAVAAAFPSSMQRSAVYPHIDKDRSMICFNTASFLHFGVFAKVFVDVVQREESVSSQKFKNDKDFVSFIESAFSPMSMYPSAARTESGAAARAAVDNDNDNDNDDDKSIAVNTSLWHQFCIELVDVLKADTVGMSFLSSDVPVKSTSESAQEVSFPLLTFFGNDISSALVGEGINKSYIDTTADLDMHSSASLRDEALCLIATTPWGQSCRASCCWDQLFRTRAHSRSHSHTSSTSTISMLSFILEEQESLASLCPGVRFVCFNACGDDCTPLLTQLPTHTEVRSAIELNDFGTVGAWCLSAHAGCIDGQMFLSNALNIFFVSELESGGGQGLALLLVLLLKVSFASPPETRFYTFQMCMRSIMYVSGLNSDAIQKQLLDALLSLERDEQSAGTSSSKLQSADLTRMVICLANSHPDVLNLLSAHRKLLIDSVVRMTQSATASRSYVSSPRAGSLETAIVASSSSSSLLPAPYVPTTTVAATPCDVSIQQQRTDTSSFRDRNQIVSAGTPSTDVSKAGKAFITDLLATDFALSKDSPSARKLQNALEKIAGDLYSSDVHFVMELVQNADDNTYKRSVTPTLKLDMYAHAMVIRNNEVGFSESNIRAICNVGGSTKAGQIGYIGQKGIGFKSVFSVSDAPEIHSNGFHIRFDRSNMIEPIWIEEAPSKPWPEHVCNEEYFATIIRLNLDERACKNYAMLNVSLEDAFEGKLLLFLNKLQRMELEDKCKNRKLEHSKSILASHWTRMSAKYENYPLHHSSNSSCGAEGEDSYWFIKRRRFVPQIRRNQVIMDTTEVAVAFQFRLTSIEELTNTNTIPVSAAMVPHNVMDAAAKEEEEEDALINYSGQSYAFELQPVLDVSFPVYAFLPTKEHVLRFIVQGDYLLSSSRECILEGELREGHEWNKTLLAETAQLAVEAFIEMFCKVWNLKFGETNECGQLDQLFDHHYRVSLEPMDVISLLPMRQTMKGALTPLFTFFSSQFYSILNKLPFMRSRDGVPLVPKTDAISAHHLSFNPRDLLAEELLFECTGRRFLDDSVQLDDDTARLFQIPLFNEHTVLQCATCLEAKAKREGSVDVPVLVGILLLLAQFAGCTAVSGSNRAKMGRTINSSSRSNNLVPTQVLVRRGGGGSGSGSSANKTQNTPTLNNSSSGGDGVDRASFIALIDKLKAMEIWPSTSGRLVSLSKESLFIRSHNSFSPAQMLCMEAFRHTLPMLDEALLIEASHRMPSGRELLLQFVSIFLKAPLAVGGSITCQGGLDELTSEIIIKKCIVPRYTKGYALNNNENDDDNRTTYAAFLAFIYLSSSSSTTSSSTGSGALSALVDRLIGKAEIIVPVCIPNANNSHWDFSGLYRVRRFPLTLASKSGHVENDYTKTIDAPTTAGLTANNRTSTQAPANDDNGDDDANNDGEPSQLTFIEVHLGLEDPGSAAVRLAKYVHSALRQLRFFIIDPLCAAYATGDKNMVSKFKAASLSNASRIDNLKDNWKHFLTHLGVVNMFNAQETSSMVSSSQIEQCSVVRLIKHIIRNGVAISTSMVPSTAVTFTEQGEQYEDEEKAELAENTHLPIFLNFPQDKALTVTKQVYKTIEEVVVSCIATELKSIQHRSQHHQYHGRNSSESGAESRVSPFLQYLNELAWFPAYVDDSLWRGATCGGNNQQLYVLTSPRNIFAPASGNSVDSHRWRHNSSTDIGSPFGPQTLYVSSELHDTIRHSPLLCESFSFIIYEPINPACVPINTDVLLTMLEWMVYSQEDRQCYSSESIMIGFYEQLFHIVEQCSFNATQYNHDDDIDGGDSSKSLDVKRLRRVWRFFDGPCIWTPKQKKSTSSTGVNGESPTTTIVLGVFSPLCSFVKNDPSDKFIVLENGPLKVLKDYFSSSDVMERLFTRKRYCSVCQAREGMFGVRGGPIISPAATTTTTTTYSTSSSPMCSCADDGFGKYHPKGGMIKVSPSIQDVANLLKYHRDTYLEAKKEAAGTSVVNSSRTDDWEYLLLQPVKQILTELSANIWKCFHIPQALHPYAATSLKGMRDIFRAQQLLPTLNMQFSTSTGFTNSGKQQQQGQGQGQGLSLMSRTKQVTVIAVDSAFLWELFREELCIDVSQKHSETMPVTVTGEQEEDIEKGRCEGQENEFVLLDALPVTEAMDIDNDEDDEDDNTEESIDKLVDDVAALLKLPSQEFAIRTSTLPLKTFNAPTKLKCLLKFLEIPTLSTLVEDTFNIVPVTVSTDAAADDSGSDKSGFVKTMNKLLLIAQTFLYTKRKDVLAQLETMDHSRLHALLSLKVVECSQLERGAQLIVNETIIEKSGSVPYYYNAKQKVMFISVDIGLPALRKLCIGILVRSLYSDIAKINYKQDSEMMSSLEACLTKMSTIDDSGIAGAMQVQDLQPLPLDEMVVWLLHCTRRVDAMNPDTKDSDDLQSHIESVKETPIDESIADSAIAAYRAAAIAAEERALERRQQQQQLKNTFINPQVEKLQNDSRESIARLTAAMDEANLQTNPNQQTMSLSPAVAPSRISTIEVPRESYDSASNSRRPPPTSSSSSSSSNDSVGGVVGLGGLREGGEGQFNLSLIGSTENNNDVLMTTLPLSMSSFSSLQHTVSCAAVNTRASCAEDGEEAQEGAAATATASPSLLTPAALSCSSVGHIGEQRAYDFFRRDPNITAVTWINEQEEMGHPYDLVLEYKDGTVKYCEVKTRIVTHPEVADKWFISPKELKCAYENINSYFVFCLSISVDPSTEAEAYVVGACIGLKDGLVSAVRGSSASLYIQINSPPPPPLAAGLVDNENK